MEVREPAAFVAFAFGVALRPSTNQVHLAAPSISELIRRLEPRTVWLSPEQASMGAGRDTRGVRNGDFPEGC